MVPVRSLNALIMGSCRELDPWDGAEPTPEEDEK